MAGKYEHDEDRRIARHYTRGTLGRLILDKLANTGKDLDRLTPADLAPVDEFHIGGRQATVEFAAQLEFLPHLHVLDIGCGLGGASRYFAQEHGCRVTGVDLTDEYVRVAAMLSQRVGLEDRVSYLRCSALRLPFGAASFDGAYMLHVGMNIRDKAALFAEVRRVLRPGSVFGVYDIVSDREGELSYPVPWSSTAETSFVESMATYRRLLEASGFVVQAERSRREFALEFFHQMRARPAQELGLHLVMGDDAGQKVANVIDNLEKGLISPAEIVCRADRVTRSFDY